MQEGRRTYGVERRSRAFDGVHLTCAEFPSYFQVPDHEHDKFGLMALLRGDLVGQAPWGSIERQPLSVAIDPYNKVRSPKIGPRGMSMLLVEFEPEAMDAAGLSLGQIGEGRVLHNLQATSAVVGLVAGLTEANETLDMWSAAIELACCFTEAQEFPAKTPPWLRTAREMIHTCFAEPMSLATVAREVGVDATHLARRFRFHFGMSVGRYIQEIRLAEATRLFVDRSMPISEAAIAAGFSDHAHFTRLFRRRFGATPSSLQTLSGGSVLGLKDLPR